jgi:hypothetical protein
MTKTISATAVTITVDVVADDESLPAGTRHVNVHISTAAARALDNALTGLIVAGKLPRVARRRDALNWILEGLNTKNTKLPLAKPKK